jgi:hypothetical protein
MGSLGTLDDAQLSDLRRRLDAWLNRDGRIVITKDFGIFTAVAEGDVKGA